jgi:hypothetical protein
VDKKELPNENEEKKVTSKFLEIYSKIDYPLTSYGW